MDTNMKDAATYNGKNYCSMMRSSCGSERRAFLDRACGGDSRLRAAVEEMLATQADVERFFVESGPALKPDADEPLFSAIEDVTRDVSPVNEQLGSWIGQYKLLRKSARAGRVVYMAGRRSRCGGRCAQNHQAGDGHQERPSARFDAERQALR